MATPLQALLYRSRIVNRLGPLHMLLLVERARKANQAHGITGQLVYFDHGFMQYLEGPGLALEDCGASWALQKSSVQPLGKAR